MTNRVAANSGRVLRGGDARHFGRRDAFEREAVADAFVDHATQALCQSDARVFGRERRLLCDRRGDRVRAFQQLGRRHDLVDHAQRFRFCSIELLLREYPFA